MRIISKEEFEQEKDVLLHKIVHDGLVFIYPTDTIYGIGCNAEDTSAVERIRRIKQRGSSPFSVIAPSKDWISENCYIKPEAREWISKLPGPYTLILELKEGSLSKNVAPDLDTIGIRIPDHWFSNLVSEMEVPIVTTSVNKSRKDFMTSLDDLDEEIKSKVDIIIYEGEIRGRPSKIVDLTKGIELVER